MPEIEVNIEIYCADCGNGLCHVTHTSKSRRGEPEFHVGLCSSCIDKIKDAVYWEGYEKGIEEHED